MFSSEPTKVSKSALLPYADSQLFGLVNDIESYPNFLEGCTDAQVVVSEVNVIEARLYLSKKGIQQSFTTRNHLYPNSRVVMELVDGPFESLNGEWNIKQLGEEGCRLSLDLEFTTGGSLIMKLAAPFFAEIGNRLVDAVVSEAGKRFGTPSLRVASSASSATKS